MLSFAVVHDITSCLIAADAEADTMGWGQPATMLLIHDRPLTIPGSPREIRGVEFPLHPDDLLTDPARLPALLHRLAAGLGNPTAPTPYQTVLDTIITQIRAATPASRLLAWATCYDDLLTVDGQQRPARRIDAVDINSRVYRLSHLRGDDHPLALVDDSPPSADIPTTCPGLVALLAATARYTQTSAAGGTP
ncbi:hypothetical protein ACIBVK_28210 [Micromonospora echinofusca]|uniref:hypothetical protein n=1 Tax=Micromonospora echinofusca TaxID=47858 RepID=UPI003798A99F